MTARTPILLVLSVLAGLFWSSGSDVSAVVIHFIAPVVIAGFATYFWRSAVWSNQVALSPYFSSWRNWFGWGFTDSTGDGLTSSATQKHSYFWDCPLGSSFSLAWSASLL